MAGDYFPVGSGFGSFEFVYRMYEPHNFLGPAYLNQAHNDAAQIVIEGGLPALLLVLCFAAWFCTRALKVWRLAKGPSVVLARTASVVVLLVAASSCFDYPLRTPLMAVMVSIMLVWLARSGSDRHSESMAPGLLGKPA
jgi:O-antigen ligase